MNERQYESESGYVAPWKEQQGINFPPPPRPGDLVPLDSEAVGSGYDYFVDKTSLRLGTDEVLRYVVVVESRTSARAVYYEGMRCETKSVKTYGYVSREGGFKPLASSPWKRILPSGPYAYRHLLAEHYMCDREGWPINEKQVLERLAQNSPSGARIRRKTAELSK